MVKNNKNGCSYGKITRNMVDNLVMEFREFKVDMKKEFFDVKKLNNELFNQLSNKLPTWAIALGGIGIAIISALIALIGAMMRGIV